MRKLLLLVIPIALLWNISTNAQTALEFDRVDDYVDGGSNFNLTSYTLEAWINWDGVSLSNENNTIIAGSENNPHVFWIVSGKMYTGVNAKEFVVIDENPMPINEWVHFAVTYDGTTGNMRMYRNGALTPVGSIFSNGDAGFVLKELYLGRHQKGNKESLFGGKLDDVRVWDFVRTAEQIADNYNSCLTGNEPGLVAFYNMEDGLGNTVASDITGNGNDGALINMDANNAWVDGVNCEEGEEEEETNPSTVYLSPVNDAYLQYSSRYNSSIIRVEKGRRTGYLMFDTSNITGTIVNAKLKFTVTSDPGYGNLNINLGGSNNWTETNLSNSNKPSSGVLLASLNDTFGLGDTKTIDLNGLESFSEDQISLVLNMTSGNDFAFGSKENNGVAKAELIITTIPSSSDFTVDNLPPVNDAYLQYGSRYNSNIIRVEKGRRTGYLMFDTSNITGDIVDAKLKFTVTSDPGYGNLDINLGESNNWTETNLSNSNKPSSGVLLASLNDTFGLGDTKTIDLNGLESFSGDQISLVLNMTSGNDFAFGSKENNGVAKAELIITTTSSNNSGDRIAQFYEPVEIVKEDNEMSINSFDLYPNPAESILNVRFNGNSQKSVSRVQIVDGFGRIIDVDSGSKNLNINVAKLRPGLYYVRFVIKGSNEVISKVFVKK